MNDTVADFESRLRLPYTLERLPLFARLYKGAFRSGCGNQTWSGTRFLNKLLYYAYDLIGWSPSYGRMALDVRGARKSIRFDARNRQFNVLYFTRYSQAYEPEVTAVVNELVPRDGVFYDIGCNWGFFSVLLASKDEFNGKVHAFEPWPSSYRDLVDVVGQAGLAHIISCHPCALGESSKQASMWCGRHSGLASIVDSGRGVQVRQESLDSLGLEDPDFMKIDAEGAEFAILRGGVNTLKNKRPMIIFENSSSTERAGSTEVMRFLESLQYEIYVPLIEFSERGGRNAFLSLGYENHPEGYAASGLRLHPVRSYTRFVFPKYLNLFACHASSRNRVQKYIVHGL